MKGKVKKKKIMLGIINTLGGIENVLQCAFKHSNMEHFTKEEWKKCEHFLKQNNSDSLKSAKKVQKRRKNANCEITPVCCFFA